MKFDVSLWSGLMFGVAEMEFGLLLLIGTRVMGDIGTKLVSQCRVLRAGPKQRASVIYNT